MQLGWLFHPWVRWELSYGNKGREVPWDVLLEPGRYVVGAYVQHHEVPVSEVILTLPERP